MAMPILYIPQRNKGLTRSKVENICMATAKSNAPNTYFTLFIHVPALGIKPLHQNLKV